MNATVIIPQSDKSSARDLIEAFLGFYGEPREAEIDLWLAALDPVDLDLEHVLATWLRHVDRRPTPIDLIRFAEREQTADSMTSIAFLTALKHGLTVDELMSPGKVHRISHPRQEAMARMNAVGRSLPQIARFFGMDHTSVLHGVRAHAARRLAEKAKSA